MAPQVALSDSTFPNIDAMRRDSTPDGRDSIQVTVHIRRPVESGFPSFAELCSPDHRHISREEFAAKHSAAAADVAAVKAFAKASGLRVVSTDALQRAITLVGTIDACNAAFGVELQHFGHPSGHTFRSHRGPIHVPEGLKDIVEGVVGLSNPSIPRRHPRRSTGERSDSPPVSQSYWPNEVASFYSFPGSTGQGECIGIIELGGGYYESDLDAYWQEIQANFPSFSPPRVGSVGSNTPNPNDPTDGEVALDIDVAGAVAYGANVVVYFPSSSVIRSLSDPSIVNTIFVPEQELLDTVSAAIHDKINQPSVLSISYGWTESFNSRSFLIKLNQLFEDAAALGITVFVSAGDNGSYGGNGTPHIPQNIEANTPASCPAIVSVGGTQLDVRDGRLIGERVWNDLTRSGGATGGGFSGVYIQAPVQAGSVASYIERYPQYADRAKYRAIPDIASEAAPGTGYKVFVNDAWQTVGGTSASAPLWAALTALINEKLVGDGKQRLGLATRYLYDPACVAALNKVTPEGGNGLPGEAYPEAPGWNPCTGL
ncbi:MAG: S8 family serine peptidase, partial [Planctomycetes bacterium]|nr:S8 family serine peptidase [Planctomycetota bacterium]